jgi:type III restriction enzyme
MPVQFSLSYVDNAAAQAVGAGFEREFPVKLRRQAIEASRDIQGIVAVTIQHAGEEDATQR